VPSRSINGRYQVQERAESPLQAATPPRSPLKKLPTAPDPATRTASSQRYIKTSATRSPLPSPYLDQPSNGHSYEPRKKDRGHRVKSPNPTRAAKSSEPTKTARDAERGLTTKTSQTLRPAGSPEPPRAAHSPEPVRSAKNADTARRVKSPEPETARRVISPEPETARRVRSPEPGRSSKSPETARQLRSPEPTRTFRSPEPTREAKSPEPMQEMYGIQAREQEQRVGSSDSGRPFKSPVEIMARMRELSSPKPAVPERSASRRKSFSERTLSFLRKKPFDEQEYDDEDALSRSSTILPIQAHSAKATPGKATPTKKVSSPPVRRMSSRKQKAMSMSTYSTSPTSPTNPDESPVIREASPAYTRGGKPVPSQSTYAQLSLLTMQPMSPLEHPFDYFDETRSQPTESPVKSNPPTSGSILKIKAALDDSEGSVNTNHPLLQKARHTRFARNTSKDLPLRQYSSHGALTQSNPDLTLRQSDEMVPPKRSSSLFYNLNKRPIGASPEPPQHSRSLTPNDRSASQATNRSYRANNRSSSQATNRSYTPNHDHLQNRSAISLTTRAHNAPSEAELGIHPAHRTPEPPEPASASTAASSPSPSTTSSVTEHNATPPPITTTRSPISGNRTTKPASPPSRFAPLHPSQQPHRTDDSAEPKTQDHWHPHHQATGSNSSNNPLVSTHPKYKTTATTNTPFYLNPASSTALIDFLASTPPPSPPHPGTRTDRAESPSAASNASAAFFNRSFVANHYPKDGEASPPPPGPGARSMTSLGRHDTLIGEDLAAKKKGWKKVFGGGGKSSKKTGSSDGLKFPKKGKKGKFGGGDGIGNGVGPVNRVGEGGGAGGVQTEGGFVGMGKDGVWISRKNFVKT
jgi:hypothetical protein